MGFPFTHNPEPGTDSSAPWDFSTLLQKTADQRIVSHGPGGTYAVLEHDTLFPPPISKAGIEGASRNSDLRTNDPRPEDPSFAGIGLWDTSFALTFVNVLLAHVVAAPVDGADTISGDSPLKEWLSFQEEAMKTLSEEEVLSPTEIAGGAIQAGPTVTIGSEGVTTVAVRPGDTEINAAFLSWIKEFTALSSMPLPALSGPTQAVLSGIASTNIEVVKKTLLGLAHLETLSLTPTQRALISEKIDVLADVIVDANEKGDFLVQGSTIQFFMISVFSEVVGISAGSTMKAADRELIGTVIFSISANLTQANFEKAICESVQSPDYLSLISADPHTISSLLLSIGGSVPLPPGVTNTDLAGALSALTTTLCSLSADDQQTVQSVDIKKIIALLTASIEGAVASGIISSDVGAKLTETLIPTLANGIFSINRTKLQGDLRSKDLAALENSLVTLSGIKTAKNLTPVGRNIVMSYLQVLMNVLVFMANLRCLMIRMEGVFTKELSDAKALSTLAEVKLAQEIYSSEIGKVLLTYEKSIDDIRHQKLMAWLMPFIAVLVAIIMAIITVVCAIFTGGLAGAPLVALTATMIGAIVGCVASVVGAIVTLVDAICSWTTGKSMWAMMCQSMGITDPLEIAAITAAFQILIQIIIIVCTVGVSAGLSGAVIASALIPIVIKVAIQSLVDVLFSSGLITAILNEIGKALFPDPKDAGIFAVVMTVVLLIISIVAMLFGGKKLEAKSKAIESAAAAVAATAKAVVSESVETAMETAEAVKDSADAIKETTKTAGEVVESTAGTAAGAAGAAAGATSKMLTKIQNFFSKLLNSIKSYYADLFSLGTGLAENVVHILRVVTMFFELAKYTAKISLGAVEIKQKIKEAEFHEMLAQIAVSQADIRALMQVFKDTSGIDQSETIEQLIAAGKEDAENWSKIVEMVSSFVKDASHQLAELSNKGSM